MVWYGGRRLEAGGEWLAGSGWREAADALKGKTAAAVAELSNQLYQTDSALSLLDSRNGASSQEGMQSLQEALKGMESLALQPGGIMSRQLQELKDSLPFREFDPETARRLKEQLDRPPSSCAACAGSAACLLRHFRMTVSW